MIYYSLYTQWCSQLHSTYLVAMEFAGGLQKCLLYKVNSIQIMPNPEGLLQVKTEQAKTTVHI